MDALFQTNWDTTRCSAASAVAMAMLAGPGYVVALADYAVRTLEARLDAVWALVDGLDSAVPRARDQARRALVIELQRHMNAFHLSFSSAAAELGYSPSRTPGIGVGLPARPGEKPLLVSDGQTTLAVTTATATSSALTVSAPSKNADAPHWFVRDGVTPLSASQLSVPRATSTVPWYRIDDSGARVHLQSKDIELAAAGQMLAFYQLTGDELRLVERIISCLGSELAKARVTYSAMANDNGSRQPQALQQLADSLVITQQHSAVGLNAAETGEALRACGLHVESTGRAIAWEKLPRAASPGESLLLEGRGHAITFGRLPDGRGFIYDSEGILGDRNAACLRFAEPGGDAALDAHYGVFKATHRVRPMRAHDRAA